MNYKTRARDICNIFVTSLFVCTLASNAYARAYQYQPADDFLFWKLLGGFVIPAVGIFYIVKLLRKTDRQIKKEQAEIKYNNDIRAKEVAGDSTSERLLIPLEYAVSQLSEDSKLSGRQSSFWLGTSIMVIFAFSIIKSTGASSLSFTVSIPLLFIAAVGVYFVLNRMNHAKQLLGFYEREGIPKLILDSSGLTIPLLLFPLANLAKVKKTLYHLKWQDITDWTPVTPPLPQRSFYRITLKEGVALEGKKAILQMTRSFSAEDDIKIIKFIKQHLSFPLAPIPVNPDDKPWFKRDIGAKWSGRKITLCVLTMLYVMYRFHLLGQ